MYDAVTLALHTALFHLYQRNTHESEAVLVTTITRGEDPNARGREEAEAGVTKNKKLALFH